MQGRFKMPDDFGLFYRQWKAKGAVDRVVLCLHGIEVHSGAFRFMGPELAEEGSEVYAFDRRGSGNSKEDGLHRGDTRDFGRHLADVDDVVELVRKANPGKKLHVFGHSIGCAYVLRYAAMHPETVDGIILAAPPVNPGFKVPAADALRLPFQQIFSPHSTYNLLSKWPKAFIESEEFKLIAEDELCTREFGVRWLLKTRTNLTNKMLRNAERMEKPALVLQGDADIIALPIGSERVVERLSSVDKTLLKFPGADHFFYHAIIPTASSKYPIEKQREVSSAVREWLRAH